MRLLAMGKAVLILMSVLVVLLAATRFAQTHQDLSSAPVAVVAISCPVMERPALMWMNVMMTLTTVIKPVPTLMGPSLVPVRTVSHSSMDITVLVSRA
jgi:hypothetical protein